MMPPEHPQLDYKRGNAMLLSIIIPVYNGEKHIDRSVQSILPQLDGRVELILVNDGSTDKTGAICDQYALKYPDIKVIHTENRGSSSARNAGIDVAQGEYLSFLDSDDYWEENSCNEICKVILQEKPDIFDFGWRYVTDGTTLTPAFHKLPKRTLLNNQTIQEVILPPLLNLRDDPDHFIFDFACMKVYKTAIIRTYGVRFDESRRTWEDRPFLVRFLKYCNSFYSMDQCFYNYVDTPNSLGRRYNMDFFKIIIENYQLYRSLFGDEYDFDTVYVNGYWSKTIEKMLFRSLEGSKNCTLIRQKMLEALADEQVIYWFHHRVPQNTFEKKVGALIVSGEAERALQQYEKFFYNSQQRERIADILTKSKAKIKKVLGKT